MKTKKILIFILVALLSLTMMGCPEIKNAPPEFKQEVDGELKPINNIIYEHPQGVVFDPSTMVQSLVDNQNLMAIDYIQSGVIIGTDRPYNDISDQIEVTSFYEIWLDGDDVNNDGVIDSADEDLWGTIKVDDDGNKIYDQAKIFIVRILAVDQTMAFTLRIVDDEGDSTELSGTILIVANE